MEENIMQFSDQFIMESVQHHNQRISKNSLYIDVLCFIYVVSSLPNTTASQKSLIEYFKLNKYKTNGILIFLNGGFLIEQGGVIEYSYKLTILGEHFIQNYNSEKANKERLVKLKNDILELYKKGE